MTVKPEARPRATVDDLLRVAEDERFHEIIGGELVRKAAPTGEHGDAQSAVVARIKGPYQRRPGGRYPGGWWIFTEVEVELEPTEVYRPEAVGWRRARVPERPTGTPIRTVPDWVCEVISPSNARTDTMSKLRSYHRAGVSHYWIVDPREETLAVFRHAPEGYLLAQKAARGETLRPEPFGGIELPVGVLFGDDPDD